MRHLLSLLLLATGAGVTAHAIASQSVSSIGAVAAIELERRATSAGYPDAKVEVRPIDGRLNLSRCGQPLEVLPDSSSRILGQVSVGIRCNGSKPWTVYVRGMVSAEQRLPVLKSSLTRGDIVSERDLEYRRVTLGSSATGYISKPSNIVGMELRRPLAAGSKFKSSDLKAPTIIDRGQTVDLVARSMGLVVNMQGIALAPGAAGDRLSVKNLSSGKRVDGLVLSSGEVLVR